MIATLFRSLLCRRVEGRIGAPGPGSRGLALALALTLALDTTRTSGELSLLSTRLYFQLSHLQSMS